MKQYWQMPWKTFLAQWHGKLRPNNLTGYFEAYISMRLLYEISYEKVMAEMTYTLWRYQYHSKCRTSQSLPTWFALCYDLSQTDFTHILHGYFTGTGAIIPLWRIWLFVSYVYINRKSLYNHNKQIISKICTLYAIYCIDIQLTYR